MTPHTLEPANLAKRALKTGTVFTLVATTLLLAGGQPNWALSFCAGASLSLFSLLSLGAAIVMLFRTGAPKVAPFLLMLVFFLKLPFYALCLWAALHLGANPFALLPGAVLLPMILGCQAMGTLLNEAYPQESNAKTAPLVAETKLQRALEAVRALYAEPLSRRG